MSTAERLSAAVGVIKLGKVIQVVLGTHAERIEREMKGLLQ